MTKKVSLKSYTNVLIEECRLAGRYRTVENYGNALRKFLRFLQVNDVDICSIHPRQIIAYEQYLLNVCELTRNTSSYYLRNLRSIINRFYDEYLYELSPQQYYMRAQLFARVFTGVEQTSKRAVDADRLMRVLVKEKQTCSAEKERAIDLFLFSFICQGISFVDMAHLKTSNVQGGRVTFLRRKTGQKVSVAWHPLMQRIVDKYHEKGSPYLFPILTKAGNHREQCKRALMKVNRYLKEIGRRNRLPVPLTSYVARHTWATTAQQRDVPMATISRCLGHASERTTKIYLSGENHSLEDSANRLIIGEVEKYLFARDMRQNKDR